eukprot:CAMPEP_0116089376 /NCGR_PEP_ID=MMETSP0327-20121206/6392_1 /TAXON_ID=44447 /ORGANISM="Pseudo-nitzschia delicatissima, Strain B596" /LENGTH=384 /DNA_ID=CAMNT_0003580563 /DNA_START=44 /DNA_END=1198 /DNA_ORIENTATION=-
MSGPLKSRKQSSFSILAFKIAVLLLSVLAENHCCHSFSFGNSIATRTTTRQTGINNSITFGRNKGVHIDSSVALFNNNGDEPIDNHNSKTMLPSVSQETRDSLEGKSVLLTGASGGLGAQLAIQIASYCNPKTLILSGRKEGALQTIAEECKSSAGDVHIVTADLSDKDSVRALGESALNICDVDVLINCGGVSSRSDFLETTLEVDEKVMQINFFAGASLAKAFVPGMVTKGDGKIIWISSVQGLMGIPSRTSYAASKFAVQGYCEAMRAELATSGVSVHCVSPGYIRTNLSLSAVTGDGSAHGTMDETTANGADPRDVAVEILNKACKGDADFVVAATASAKVAIWLRLLFPKVLQNLLVKRFEKAKKKKEAAIPAGDKKMD